jgi:hypothetical protein
MKRYLLLSLLSLIVTSANAGLNLSVTFSCGHAAGSSCVVPNVGDVVVGICPTCGWQHIPCVGSGSNCTWTVGWTSVGLSSSDSTVETNVNYDFDMAIPIGYGERTFVMPARSIYMSSLHLYINCPEQSSDLTQRGSEWIFPLHNVTFSESPLYTND